MLSSLSGWRVFFYIRITIQVVEATEMKSVFAANGEPHTLCAKLGGTARTEKLVPRDDFSFCVFRVAWRQRAVWSEYIILMQGRRRCP